MILLILFKLSLHAQSNYIILKDIFIKIFLPLLLGCMATWCGCCLVYSDAEELQSEYDDRIRMNQQELERLKEKVTVEVTLADLEEELEETEAKLEKLNNVQEMQKRTIEELNNTLSFLDGPTTMCPNRRIHFIWQALSPDQPLWRNRRSGVPKNVGTRSFCTFNYFDHVVKIQTNHIL